MGDLQVQIAPVMLALAHVLLGVIVLVVAKLLKGWISPYRMDEELTSRDNPAFGLALAGYYLAVVIVFIAAARAQAVPLDAGTQGALTAFGLDMAWAVGGILALGLSRFIMDRTLVTRCCQSDEIVKNRNVAAGAVECGVYLASGIVIAGALREPGGTIVTTLVFFALSQIILLVFGKAYERVVGYDIAREIRSGNLAAGVALGLTLVAISLLMLKALSGEFLDWGTNLTYFAFDAVVGFGLLLLLRWVVDLVLLPNARIADEISRDRNVNVGLLEGVLSAGVAAIILMVF
ncbi:MAG TPA: DUF350 domain-containing protein [Bryobacteraceae bacterium]|nr:DUF350 domain-containing protein [Bryobacteraceae bacterium]